MVETSIIDRINGINRVKTESNHENLSLLAYEYLRRLSYFFNENSLKPINPMFASVIAYITKDYSLSNSKKTLRNTVIN